MGRTRFRACLPAQMLVVALCSAMAIAPVEAVAETTVQTRAPSEPKIIVVDPVTIELEEFADREAANPDLADFIGGNPVVIVIGTGTLFIIIVVVLVVLILR